jgi:hypothetical protein
MQSSRLSSISDLPPEVEATLDLIKNDEFSWPMCLEQRHRLEEAFRTIAEREADREKTTGRPSHDRK